MWLSQLTCTLMMGRGRSEGPCTFRTGATAPLEHLYIITVYLSLTRKSLHSISLIPNKDHSSTFISTHPKMLVAISPSLSAPLSFPHGPPTTAVSQRLTARATAHISLAVGRALHLSSEFSMNVSQRRTVVLSVRCSIWTSRKFREI